MLLAILAIYFGYKKAKDSGRNPILWAAICGGAFIGTQLVIGLLIGVVMGIGVVALGWSERIFEDYSTLISIVAAVISLVLLYFLFKFLDRPPVDKSVVTEPPPPPNFSDEQ